MSAKYAVHSPKRLVLTLDEPAFGNAMHKVLSPSETIQTPELLKGRDQQLAGIRQALYARGRHIFVHGHRGVGKSSLAQTAAFLRQSSDKSPIMVSCDPSSTCFTIVRDIAQKAFNPDPQLTKIKDEIGGKVKTRLLDIDGKHAEEKEAFRIPETLNDAVRVMTYVAENYATSVVAIIDEFDQVGNDNGTHEKQNLFAHLVKQLSEQHIPISIIFCGIGESLDDLFSAHLSAHRHFHPVPVERLSWEARQEIIANAADHLGIEIDDTTSLRIAQISDGFPHYVHLICEQLFWLVYHAHNEGRVTGDLFEKALQKASEELAPRIKVPYEKATKKYSNSREPILWAAADGDALERPSRDIWRSYVRIMADLGKDVKEDESAKRKFNGHMNGMKKANQGAILTGTRSGWYTYTEKLVRGYARLRAHQHGITLEREHPMQRKRFEIYDGEKDR